MERIFTHYDNLKVARDAPPEVIRAAYKSLAHKYHPDRNQNNPGASRIMLLINIAYEELSDPVKRRLHDEWIREQEKLRHTHPPKNGAANHKTEGSSNQRSTNNKRTVVALLLFTAIIALANIIPVYFQHTDKNILSSSVSSNISSPLSAPNPPTSSTWDIPYPHKKPGTPTVEEYQSVKAFGQILRFPVDASLEEMAAAIKENEASLNPNYRKKEPQVKLPYARPVTAPNGEMWPSNAAYIKGYKKLHTDGLSSVTIDNTQNDSDVFVKLVSISGNNASSVRHFFIPATDRFTVNKVRSGNYDIRYRDLDSGTLAKSETFMLQQKSTPDGIQYSNITMTLYKVRDGNMRTYTISEAEF